MSFIKVKASNMSLAKRKPVFGAGVNDADYAITTLVEEKRFMCPVYSKWHCMIRRCYCLKYLSKKPTYVGCSVCDEWLTFSNFSKWYEKHNIDGYELDKDIKIKGNKIYSPNACLFVPQAINALLTNCEIGKGLYKLGVATKSKYGKYRSQIRIDGKTVYLGMFDSEGEAHNKYIKAKNKEINRKMTQYPEFAIYLKQHIKHKSKLI